METAFHVIYSFRVNPGMDAEFKASWAGLTRLIYEYEGSLGSKLHKAGPELYIAYARWPDRETWAKSGDKLPVEADALRTQMRAACSKVETLFELEPEEDLLREQVFGG